MLVPTIETRIYFHWSDVEKAVAHELECDVADLEYVLREWMEEHDSEAGGNSSIGVHHNFDKQIADIEAKVAEACASGAWAGMDSDEMEDYVNDTFPTRSFLKAIKKVLGEHSTKAAFLYSW